MLQRRKFFFVTVTILIIKLTISSFGGVKHSGFGREGSKYGCDDYLVYKTIVTGEVNTVYQSHL
jgi:succinate-semialdehyde dehydrogenase/glutarate-semialdehyde dehydrogenase